MQKSWFKARYKGTSQKDNIVTINNNEAKIIENIELGSRYKLLISSWSSNSSSSKES